jgi:formamidopyrimidine-DNA glycosylase
MPELPEVEHARRLLERLAAGRRIEKARAAEDRIVFADPRAVERALARRRIVRACRHGKWLWLELDRGPHPLLHFGMTGGLRLPDDDPLMLKGGPRRPDLSWPPRFTKLELDLDDGTRIALVDARRLGRVHLRDDPRGEPPIKDLGFDALNELPSFRRFRELLARRSGPIKAVLLDQGFSAGVGNWVADEVLYQARLDPRRPVPSLDDAELRRLRSKIHHVVKVAVDADADDARYPRSWLFHHRWRKGKRTARGEKIEHTVVGGRTTAYVPTRQR